MTKSLGEFECVSVSLSDSHDGVAFLRLARPERSNAISDTMLQEIPKALSLCEHQAGVRAIVLCGDGKNFCAGLDLNTLAGIRSTLSAGECPAWTRHEFRLRIESMQVCYCCC